MNCITLRGGRPLEGELTLSGAKNGALPLLAATLLCRGSSLLHNCPRLTDVDGAVEILRHLGCRVRQDGHDILVDPAGLCRSNLPRNLMGRMRSSVFFLGPLLARMGECALYEPGGCCLGARPIDMHLKGLERMGAVISQEMEQLRCCGTGLHGAAVILPYPSVGATENLMMAALGAVGTTTIYNAAREPEIVDLAGFLRAGGAKIYGAGTGMVQIEPGLPNGVEYTVLPDRIEAATYLSAGAAAGGHVVLRGANEAHLFPVCKTLRNAGCQIRSSCDIIELKAGALRCAGLVRTAPYPGFPTDAQAVTMAALVKAEGTTVFEETVFSDRFRHVPQLEKLGARIEVRGSIAAVRGVSHLTGARMEATDLRGGAAMVVAALGAEGESAVGQIQHIERGYEDFVPRLASLGAQIQITKEP